MTRNPRIGICEPLRKKGGLVWEGNAIAGMGRPEGGKGDAKGRRGRVET